MSLLEDLQRGEAEASGELPCTLCEYINTLSGEPREALLAASGGTIGIRKLTAIMQRHDTGVGQRTIARHRSERHTP